MTRSFQAVPHSSHGKEEKPEISAGQADASEKEVELSQYKQHTWKSLVPLQPALQQDSSLCLRTHCVSIAFPPFSFPQGFQAATCQFCHTPSSPNLVAGMNYRLFEEKAIQAKVKGCFNQTRLKEYQEFGW